MKIKIKRVENGKIPEYKTSGSAGADCFARIDFKQIIKPKSISTIPLGFMVEIPEGYEMQIRSRSGLARKNGVQIFNSPGTIDSDYRGEVGAIIYNSTDSDFIVNPGDRIAQMVIAPVIKADFQEVEDLSETERGSGGYGSTGVSETKIEKFYEPFTTFKEIKNTLGAKVIIDNKEAIINSVEMDDKKILISFLINESNETIKILPTQAFQRVTLDGHRFGREIVFNEEV